MEWWCSYLPIRHHHRDAGDSGVTCAVLVTGGEEGMVVPELPRRSGPQSSFDPRTVFVSRSNSLRR